jgi:O-antigen/teichoic acid export membrane protein
VIGPLWRDGFVYAAGTLVTRGLGLLLLPLYARALEPANFGILDLIVAAGVLVNLVVPLETPQAVARFWHERPMPERRSLAGTGAAFAAATYALFVAVAWQFEDSIALALGLPQAQTEAVRAGAAFVAVNGLMLVLQAQFRFSLRPGAFALAGVGYAALVLVGMVGLVAAANTSVAHVLWMQAAAAGLVSLWCAWALRYDLIWRIDGRELAGMLRFSLPLVPAGLAMFGAVHAHRFMLGWLGTLEQVGLFALASRVASVATLVLIGVQGALTPLIYAHHRDPDTPARLARLFERFWSVGLLVCLMLTTFGADIVPLLAGPGYVDAAGLLVWLAPATLLAQMYIFLPGIPLARKTHWQLWITVTAAASGLLMAFAVVPFWQAYGAAAATFIAAGGFFAGWLVAGQRLYPLPLRGKRLLGVTLLYAALAAAAVRLPVGSARGTARIFGVILLLTLVGALIGSRLLQGTGETHSVPGTRGA